MKISVVIPCLNAEATIGDQLEALSQQSWEGAWEVIVSDNGSTDGSLRIVEQYCGRIPNLSVVDASGRKGQPYAMNVAAQGAKGESLAFCDADDEVGPGWLAAMAKALEEHEFVAGRFDSRKLNPEWVQNGRGTPQQDSLQQYRYPPFLPHAGSGNMGIRRALFEQAGGFDESLSLLFDTDLCWRLQLEGKQLQFAPEAVLNLRHRRTIRAMSRQARSYGEYNVLLYKRYLLLGMPRLSWRQALSGWVNLLRRLPKVRSKASLATWIWQISWRYGRMRGSLKHRIFAL